MICACSFWVGLGDVPMLSGRLLWLLDCGLIVSVRGLVLGVCGFAVVGLFYSGIGWPDSGAWCCLLLHCVGGLCFRCGGFVLVFWWVWWLRACL